MSAVPEGRATAVASTPAAAAAPKAAHPEDGLDADNDGIACENLPSCSAASFASGSYYGFDLQHGVEFELLLEVTPYEGPVQKRGVRGIARWGDSPSEEGDILGSVVGDTAWLEVGADEVPGQPDSTRCAFGMFIDLRTHYGAFVGVDPVTLRGLPAAGELLVTTQ